LQFLLVAHGFFVVSTHALQFHYHDPARQGFHNRINTISDRVNVSTNKPTLMNVWQQP
jgi:hypothetical protein